MPLGGLLMPLRLKGAGGEETPTVKGKVRRRGGARGKRVRIRRAIEAGSGEVNTPGSREDPHGRPVLHRLVTSPAASLCHPPI